MADENQDDRTEERTWRWAELLFGGGVLTYVIGSAITGVWWASSIDTKIDVIEGNIATLDNVSLGNRLTAIETKVGSFDKSLDGLNMKIDILLERRVARDPR